MSVSQPPIRWIGANPNNYTSGRQGHGVKYIVFHHIVGPLSSADATFQNPNRIASAHFGVGSTEIHQYVALGNTSYANGNWVSNLESVTIEHEGDWRFGYKNDAVLAKSAQLVAWLRTLYPAAVPKRHRDISSTQCCGDLPVEQIWNMATDLMKPPVTQQPEWLRNRVGLSGMYYAQVDGMRIWDLNNPSQPADSRTFARNTNFEIGSQTVVGGQKFYITKSSTDTNKANGLKASELSTTPWAAPAPPPVEPPPVTTPEWLLNLQDIPNKKMYVVKDTMLIDLLTGTPVYSNGKEVLLTAGKTVDDVSATTIVQGKTYALTEYSYGKKIARGFAISDLSDTDPNVPVEPPVTPTPPVDTNAVIAFLQGLIAQILDFIAKLGGKK